MLDGKTIDALAMQYAARSHHTQLTCTSSRVLAAQGTTKRSGPPRADMAGESPRPRAPPPPPRGTRGRLGSAVGPTRRFFSRCAAACISSRARQRASGWRRRTSCAARGTQCSFTAAPPTRCRVSSAPSARGMATRTGTSPTSPSSPMCASWARRWAARGRGLTGCSTTPAPSTATTPAAACSRPTATSTRSR